VEVEVVADWSVLGLEADPVPGDPNAVGDLAARLSGQAGLTDTNTDRLRAIAANGGDLQMVGDYAPHYLDALHDLPGDLAKLAAAYHGCSAALRTYSSSLAAAKTQAGTALRNGTDAALRYQAALGQVHLLLPPDRDARLIPRDELSDHSIALATAGWEFPDLTEQVRLAARRGQAAQADRARARQLALDAAQLRDEAASTCAHQINEALSHSGIKNKPWYEKAWHTVSEPFRSWHAFVGLCRDVALVAGAVALVISGPIGVALAGIALVAGAAALGDSLGRFAAGRGSFTSVALDALGMIPGDRELAAAGRMSRGLRLLTGGLARGEGSQLISVGLRTTATAAALRRARDIVTAVPFGLSQARAARGTLALSEVFTKTAKCRFLGRDPIELSTGQMIMRQTDVELPGILPWALQRTYMSSYQAGRAFGPSWSSTLDVRLELDDQGVCYAAPDAVLLAYPHPDPGSTVMPERGPRLPLTRTDTGEYVIVDDEAGQALHFAVPAFGQRQVGLPLAGIVDPNGNRITFDYTADGTIHAARHSGGYTLAFDTIGGLVTAVRLLTGPGQPDQELIRYGYDRSSRLTDIVNSSGQPLRFDYTPEGRLTRWTDRNGTTYDYTYDTAGRVIATTGSAGTLSGTIRYDEASRVTVETNSLGHTTEYHYNAALQLERRIGPAGHTTGYTWDRYDRKLTETDPLGRTVRYAYDPAGNLSDVVYPDGTRTRSVWNDQRRPERLVGPDGAEWHYTYDERGNLTAAVDPTGARTLYRHDASGAVVEITDALGTVYRVENDSAGLPSARIDPAGVVTSYERDALGRITTITDPLGGVTRHVWTVEGRLTARELPDGTHERWTYDGEGNQIEHTDTAGFTTRTDYTHFDRPAARTDPDGARTRFTYDTELRLTTVTNPQGLTWRYDYDPAGNLIREIDFDNRVLAYTYDAAGQLTSSVNAAGESRTYTHDLVGNLISKAGADDETTFAYDPAGRVIRATSPDADVVLTRDPLGRVLTETTNGRTVTSAYDAIGRRISRTTPSGAVSHWDYDSRGLPRSLHTAGHSLTFDRDRAGRETRRSIGPDVQLTQAWDTNHHLLSQTVTAGSARTRTASGAGDQTRLLHRRDYTYSPDGYPTAIDDLRAGVRRYDLDPLRRVTAVTGASWRERYDYDPAGNITEAAWPSPNPDDDRAVQGGRDYAGTLLRRAGTVRHEHDPQGRLTLRQRTRGSTRPETWHFSWDADDRMTGATTPDGQRWRYTYDAFGRRAAKQRLTDDGRVAEQTDFTWDGPTLAEQTHIDGRRADVTTWDWEPDTFRPLTQTSRRRASDGADQEWFDTLFHTIITDLIGTPTDLISPDGDVGWTARPTLWGIDPSPAPGTVDCPLRFPGQYHDPETELDYNLHRHYDPIIGRYTSPDPLGLAAAPNPAAYTDNPLLWFDPLGLAPQECLEIADNAPWVIGKKNDLDAYRGNPLYRVLNEPPSVYLWPKNALWLQKAIVRNRKILAASDPELAYGLFGDEVNMLQYAGYKTRFHESGGPGGIAYWEFKGPRILGSAIKIHGLSRYFKDNPLDWSRIP
jgi:RHS repeat-associated protein